MPSNEPSNGGSKTGSGTGSNSVNDRTPSHGSQDKKNPGTVIPAETDQQITGIALTGPKHALPVASITTTATAPSARIAGLVDRRLVLPVVGLVACLVVGLGALAEGVQSKRTRRSRL